VNFEQSQTYKNVKSAFDGETRASTKYRIYATKAREDGYEQIGNIFDETAGNEREHAEIWMKLLHGGEIPSTLENLEDASSGEHYEWETMYRNYADTARKEGFPHIAELFDGVANIEYNHDRRYDKLIENIERGTVFCKREEYVWICLNCGNLIFGKCAPEICPVCGYPQGYYQLFCENY
jgi:Rubrerythrin